MGLRTTRQTCTSLVAVFCNSNMVSARIGLGDRIIAPLSLTEMVNASTVILLGSRSVTALRIITRWLRRRSSPVTAWGFALSWVLTMRNCAALQFESPEVRRRVFQFNSQLIAVGPCRTPSNDNARCGIVIDV